MITSVLIAAIAIAVAALIATAALSPIETLSWWAGWTEEEPGRDIAPAPGDHEEPLYIVYLSGVSSISGRYPVPREKAFVRALKRAAPDAVVIDDVFPYSPAGVSLLGATRVFERLWRRIQKIKLQGRATLFEMLIRIRNIYQVMISADHRYGPIYNQGAARVIETALLEAGYRPGGGAPVFIIGYSGGAQVAVGAAPFLTHRLKAPVDVISVGGVMASDPGLHFVRRLHLLIGDGDNVRKVGAVMFPERWPAMALSEWNIAKRDGRIAVHRLARMIHAGPRGYFGRIKFDGVANGERTLECVVDILSSAHSPRSDRGQ